MELLLQTVSRGDQGAADHQVSATPDAAPAPTAAGNLGRSARATQCRRARFRRGPRRLILEWLPGYAPELNPVEHIWGYLKEHELPNLCPGELWQLGAAARGALRRMRRRPTLVAAFWKQAELF